MNFFSFLRTLRNNYPVSALDQLSYESEYGYWHIRSAYRYYRVLNNCPQSASGPVRVLDVGAFPFSTLKVLRLMRDVEPLGTGMWSDDVQRALLADPLIGQGTYFESDLDPWVKPSKQGVPHKFSLPDASVDYVVFTEVIEHLYNPVHTMREIFRVLRPGGKLYMSTNNVAYFRLGAKLLLRETNLDRPLSLTSVDFDRDTPDLWRGHVRFYSGSQLKEICTRVGFSRAEWTCFEQCNWGRPGMNGLVEYARYWINWTPLRWYGSHLECVAVK